MAKKTQAATHLTDYLLGKLSESESEKLEKEYFEDEDAFENMLVAEEDLIDDYVSNRLSDDDRRRVQRLLASPEGRERLHFARSLAAAINNTKVTAGRPERQEQRARNSLAFLWAYLTGPRAALTAATLIVVAAIVFLLVERARMRIELGELRAERARLDQKLKEAEQVAAAAQQDRNTGNVAEETPTPSASKDVVHKEKKEDVARGPSSADSNIGDVFVDRRQDELTVELQPGLTRGGGLTTVRVSRNTRVVFLKLNLETEPSHDIYSAVLETAGGREVSRNDSFKPDPRRRGAIQVPVSAKSLVPGDYVLFLRGKTSDGNFEGVANYSFRVASRQ